MEFPHAYFEDEVRDGFYVPGMMKRAWAAQLEILEAIKNICRKHEIQYFAEWGTLLGAVRHKGFIPWDDDMDICMKRQDYNRFVSAAEKELPKNFRLMSFHNDDQYWEFLSRVVNGSQIQFDREHLEAFHGFPFVAGIDIFPLDFIAPNEEEEKLRCELAAMTASAANDIGTEGVITKEQEAVLSQIEKLCGVSIDRTKDVKRQLYTLTEHLFSLYGEEEAQELTLMPLWVQDGCHRMPKAYYEEAVLLPFENTAVPVPAAYDAVLKIKYGDYMKLVHDWDSHDYPFYKRQEKMLEQKYGQLLQRFVFSEEDLKKEKKTMNKKGKKQAQHLAQLLMQAQADIKKTAESGMIPAALSLLETCQESAIHLGGLIEQSQGEGFVTVRLLEEYCELVYRLHETLLQGGQTETEQDSRQRQAEMEQDSRRPQAETEQHSRQAQAEMESLYQALDKQVRRIQYSIRNDMKERKEIVFLPYKASMWDSLESVWRAADADPDCDAYVIPIPYYDKNPDGTFCALHYEGGQYPKDVPIVHYDAYDFAARCPDMIFIHNPYDECNLATSVHPFFYSKNLKQFTDQLVYIPYFVLDEIHPQDRRAVEGMAHFVTVPGVIHADKVIVQSEEMRQAYICALTEFAGEKTKSIWEEKILGTGSPKFDRALSTKKEDLDIPEPWLKIIEKPDGTWKKVILYNTSIGTLLQYNEQMLAKMQDVFRIFKENQEETALLFRPHPLIEAAAGSMRPQLWEAYSRIVERYKKEGWGIYDDTADIDRAIALSDAYYGDGSSVVQLCRAAGMPVMIQDVEMVNAGQDAAAV